MILVITNCSKLELNSREKSLWKYSGSTTVNLFFAYLLLKNSNFSPKSKISLYVSCPRISPFFFCPAVICLSPLSTMLRFSQLGNLRSRLRISFSGARMLERSQDSSGWGSSLSQINKEKAQITSWTH